MKNEIIILLSLLLILSISIIIILKNIIDDKTLMINGFKSDRNVCRMQKQEIIDNFKKLEGKCEK